MASINWLKLTKQKAGALVKLHLGKDRDIRKHANKDIDPTKTHLNYNLGAPSMEEAIKKAKAFVDEQDGLNPPRKKVKDRTVYTMLEAPCPLAIQELGAEDEFFQKLHKIYEDFFSTESVKVPVYMQVHKDEQHEYYDNETGEKTKSLIHSHTLVPNYVEWTEKDKDGNPVLRKGINGKNFETRKRLNELNKAVNDMVKREFGIDYNTHNKAKNKSVEQIKNDEIKGLEKAVERLTKENEALLEQKENNTSDIFELTAQLTKIKDELKKQRELIPKNVEIINACVYRIDGIINETVSEKEKLKKLSEALKPLETLKNENLEVLESNKAVLEEDEWERD